MKFILALDQKKANPPLGGSSSKWIVKVNFLCYILYMTFMTKKHIHIVKMGGTIEFKDPAYEKINDLMRLDVTIENYLKNLVNPHFSYDVEIICEKDSRDINQKDLENLKSVVMSTKQENILITHGTFTMKNTGKFIEDLIIKGKVK